MRISFCYVLLFYSSYCVFYLTKKCHAHIKCIMIIINTHFKLPPPWKSPSHTHDFLLLFGSIETRVISVFMGLELSAGDLLASLKTPNWRHWLNNPPPSNSSVANNSAWRSRTLWIFPNLWLTVGRPRLVQVHKTAGSHSYCEVIISMTDKSKR